MKIISIPDKNLIAPSEMKDGAIGIIIECPIETYKNLIVQRHGDTLIQLGEDMGCRWSNIEGMKAFKIQVLPVGTIIQL